MNSLGGNENHWCRNFFFSPLKSVTGTTQKRKFWFWSSWPTTWERRTIPARTLLSPGSPSREERINSKLSGSQNDINKGKHVRANTDINVVISTTLENLPPLLNHPLQKQWAGRTRNCNLKNFPACIEPFTFSHRTPHEGVFVCRRASPNGRTSPSKRAGFYFAFTWEFSSPYSRAGSSTHEL